MTVRRAGTPAEVNAQKKTAQRILRENREDLSKILATAEGERYIIRLLTRCGIMRSGYEGNGSKAYYEAGMRHVGVMIAAEVAALRPELVTKVLVPSAPESTLNDDERENDDDRD
jgi:hypothetical protein